MSPRELADSRHAIATFLVAGVRDDHGPRLGPQGPYRAGTSPSRGDTARGARERPRVGCASIYRYRSGARNGWLRDLSWRSCRWRVPLRWYLPSLLARC
jgi:hypothetical protein